MSPTLSSWPLRYASWLLRASSSVAPIHQTRRGAPVALRLAGRGELARRTDPLQRDAAVRQSPRCGRDHRIQPIAGSA